MVKLKKPVYFITRHHKSNYQHLLQRTEDPRQSSAIASAYVLGAIGTLDGEGRVAQIDACMVNGQFDWTRLLELVQDNSVDLALVKLAANLTDSAYAANIQEVFMPLGDEYQAVAYQALLLLFPSFSKSWERRFEFADSH